MYANLTIKKQRGYRFDFLRNVHYAYWISRNFGETAEIYFWY